MWRRWYKLFTPASLESWTAEVRVREETTTRVRLLTLLTAGLLASKPPKACAYNERECASVGACVLRQTDLFRLGCRTAYGDERGFGQQYGVLFTGREKRRRNGVPRPGPRECGRVAGSIRTCPWPTQALAVLAGGGIRRAWKFLVGKWNRI